MPELTSNVLTHKNYVRVVARKWNKILAKIYGDIDWTKTPLNRNKVDYTARIVFPMAYGIFIFIYFFCFIVPWF